MKLSIELEALLRNVCCFAHRRTATALLPQVPVQETVQIESCLGCEILVTGRCCVCQCYRSTLGGHPDGERAALPQSCLGFFERIHVGAQLVAGNSRGALDLQHTERGNLFPLRDSLLFDAERRSELGQPAGCDDGAFQWSF